MHTNLELCNGISNFGAVTAIGCTLTAIRLPSDGILDLDISSEVIGVWDSTLVECILVASTYIFELNDEFIGYFDSAIAAGRMKNGLLLG